MLKSKNELDVKICLQKKDYAVAVAEAENGTFVVCIPTRIHPNVNVAHEKFCEFCCFFR